MLLNQLFSSAKPIEIKQLSSDSRVKTTQSLFFCTFGLVHDSHEFADQAIDNGAVAVVHQRELSHYQEGIEYIKVDNVHETLIETVNRFYDDPSAKMTVIGVTGTNGKSTISLSIKHVLNQFVKTGYIGTISIEYGNVKLPPMLTTPDIIPMVKTLGDMVDVETKAVVIEASSHGLAMDRVKGIHFDQAVFTNLTHDHLDYHGTMENYYLAKKKLFDGLDEAGIAIINIDDDYGARLSKEHSGNQVTYAINSKATYQAKDIQLGKFQSNYTLVYDNQEYLIETDLVARFNIYNSLAIIASLHEAGWSDGVY